MIDTHSHLFDEAFQLDIKDCIERCREVNINKVILVGFSHQTNQQAFELAQEYPLFYPTAGLHPSEASKNYKEDLLYLEEFIKKHKIYAIGECGLDYHYGKDNIHEQKKLFQGQIELAIQYQLPLIIHMREATQDTFDILKEFIKLGFYISLGGPVTFKNAKEAKRIAEEIDLKYLLIETDCPYLAPVPYRGNRNESSYVLEVAKQIATLRGMSVQQIEEITEQNAIKLFSLEEKI